MRQNIKQPNIFQNSHYHQNEFLLRVSLDFNIDFVTTYELRHRHFFFQNYLIYSTNFDIGIKNKTSVQPIIAIPAGGGGGTEGNSSAKFLRFGPN